MVVALFFLLVIGAFGAIDKEIRKLEPDYSPFPMQPQKGVDENCMYDCARI